MTGQRKPNVPEAHVLKTALSYLSKAGGDFPEDNWVTFDNSPMIEDDANYVNWRFKNNGSAAELFLTASSHRLGWDYTLTQYDKETCKFSNLGYAEAR